MATRIQIRRDNAAVWALVNPVLGDGEIGVELDTAKAKLGDGTTNWNSLAYWDLNGALTALAAKLDDSDATSTPTASKIPVASESGVIDAGWNDPLVAREMRIAALGVNPTLDLDFSRQAYRAYNGAMGLVTLVDPFASFITFSRPSTATYFGPDGTMRTAAVNEPRIDHDPLTGECRGLLIEGQRTNFLIGSDAPVTQNVDVTAQVYTLCFYGAGTVVMSGAYSATLAGNGPFPSRAALTFTPVAGTLTLTVSGDVQYAQLEPSVVATSYIQTTTVAVVRRGDVANVEGVNFSSWYNASTSTCLFVGDTGADKQSPAVSFQSSATNRVTLSINGPSAYNTRLYMHAGGVAQVNLGQAGFVAGGRMAVAAAWATNDSAVHYNGGALMADTSCVMPVVTTMSIGAQYGSGVFPLDGHVRRIMYWPRRLSNAQLLELTK